jgi:hypothetical protein
MLFHLAPFVSLAGPFETPSGGAWDDNITYNFTTSPEYGDSAYPAGYTAMWSPGWQHMVCFSPTLIRILLLSILLCCFLWIVPRTCNVPSVHR